MAHSVVDRTEKAQDPESRSVSIVDVDVDDDRDKNVSYGGLRRQLKSRHITMIRYVDRDASDKLIPCLFHVCSIGGDALEQHIFSSLRS